MAQWCNHSPINLFILFLSLSSPSYPLVRGPCYSLKAKGGSLSTLNAVRNLPQHSSNGVILLPVLCYALYSVEIGIALGKILVFSN